MNAIALLNNFRRQRSDDAFRELVRRYTNLVYSVAKRRLGGEALAQDATQSVFIRLAQNPPPLSREAELTGWLHRTTLHVSIDLWRSEARRRAREEHAVAIQLTPDDDRSWAELKPSLDEALDQLAAADREIILLRFFNHKSMRDLGEALGVSEDAAKMRVSRAVARLRDQLAAAGVTCTVAIVSGFLAERAVEAAPASVAATVASFRYPIASVSTPLDAPALGGSGGGLNAFLLKIGTGVAVVSLVGLIVWRMERPRSEVAAGPIQFTAQGTGPGLPIANASKLGAPSAVANRTATQPSPLQLLEGVIRARQRLASGALDYQVETFVPNFRRTNRVRVHAVFAGDRQRFEQVGREYSYTYDPDPARQEEIQKKVEAFGYDKAAAVRAGLLNPFEAHYVTIHDGATQMQYRETDGRIGNATVDDAGKGTTAFVFDPRTLGLSTSLSITTTLENSLDREALASAQLVGLESVNGQPAWHVHLSIKYSRDFWFDASNPLRVLKSSDEFSEEAVSTYDGSAPSDAIPTAVTITHSRNGQLDYQTRLVQTAAQFNAGVESSTFALEGLGMQVGTPVVDIRQHRRIGYWTGTGLSDNLPRKNSKLASDAPTLEEQLSILDNMDPASEVAFDAARWILLNTPDGPPVEKAARLVLENHVRRADLGPLCQEMERMRHRGAADFLAAVLRDNPHPDVQAPACFALATLRKDESKFGADKKSAAEAEALFERVVGPFSQTGPQSADRVSKAKRGLAELRRMSLGKTAPDFAGTDLEGRPIKLSSLRGQVVAVVFWYASNIPTPEENLTALAPFAGQGFTCLSIYCGDNHKEAAPVLEKYPPPGPVIWDGNHGPIAEAWQVDSWPSVFLLDRTGLIRARNLRGPALANAVTKLLNEPKD